MHSILYVNTPGYIGGSEISLLALMANLEPGLYRPVLVTSGEGPLMQRASRMRVPVLIHTFPQFRRRRPWVYALSIYRLLQIVRSYDVTLIHTNCDRGLRHVMDISRLTGVPFVSHVRDFVRSWFQPEQVRILNKAASVIANSEAIADQCRQAGIDATRVRTIYNPVDVEQFEAASKDGSLCEDLGLSSDAFVIGMVGQIQPIKGHEEFITAAQKIATQIPESQFLIVGDAFSDTAQRFKSKLKSLVSDNEIDSRVKFLGFRHDVPDLMQLMDVAVVPSWTEPFGRVVVEGLAAGCAVVASETGGIPEIIEDEKNGLLVPPNSSEALVDAVTRLYRDRALFDRLRKAGPKSAERFSVERHVTRVQELYDSLLYT